MAQEGLTVGDLKYILDGLPDDARIMLHDGEWNDEYPAVRVVIGWTDGDQRVVNSKSDSYPLVAVLIRGGM